MDDVAHSPYVYSPVGHIFGKKIVILVLGPGLPVEPHTYKDSSKTFAKKAENTYIPEYKASS